MPEKGGLTSKELSEANERFAELAPVFSKDASPVELDASLKGLEPLAEKLNETGKTILNVVISDFSAEPTVEAEKDVFKKLKNACARAGMAGTGDEVAFFKTLGDPQFNQIVHTVGRGVIGMYIVPVAAKIINQALEGDKTSQKWVLEICGLIDSKYDFYLNRYNLTHNSINAQNVNIEGKTDEELKELISSLDDVENAVEVSCEN